MRPALAAFLVALLGCLPRPAEPTLLAVEPAFVDSNTGAPVLLTGTALVPRATLDFDRPDASVMAPVAVSAWLTSDGGRVDLADVTWLDATSVSGAVPASTPVGLWDVHLLAPRGQELVLPAALQVLDCTDVDCTPDGGAGDSGVVTCPDLNFRDRDLDGFGAGPPANFCGAGWVAMGGDCDDRDALTHPLALEVCNGLDDDCDGAIDEGGRCDAGWTADDSLRGQGDLLTAAAFAPGSLWTGGGSKLYVRRGELGLAEVGQGCPASLAALWAAAPTGEVEVAGATGSVGRLASHEPTATQCTGERLSGDPIVAMTGFQLDGGALWVGVSRTGQLSRWDRGGLPVPGATTNLPSDAVVFDLHGTAPDQLYAVGSVQLGLRRFAVWQLQRDGGWQAEQLSTVGDTKGELLALWVLAPGELVAVGREGLVLRKSAGVWRRLESDTDVDLTSVRAFSAGRFYVSQADGRVRRRAMNDWAVVFRADGGARLNDLCGTGEEDLWVVGNGGVIGRGPHP